MVKCSHGVRIPVFMPHDQCGICKYNRRRFYLAQRLLWSKDITVKDAIKDATKLVDSLEFDG